MPVLGAHMSIAGGLDKAVERAVAVGCEAIQIFTKNSNQWACKPLEAAQVDAWRNALASAGLQSPIAHSSYLINVAAPDEALWRKSLDALVIEWQRAEMLGLDGLVLHPGAYTSSTEEEGLRRVADAVRQAIERVAPSHCRLLLENTAGQGSCLGCSFEQLGWLLREIDAESHVGICLDTCHALAAGYAINTPEGYEELTQAIHQHLPPRAIRALHLNDSKKPCGSRVDRHEHIGRGEIGDDAFRWILTDPMFRDLPGYLETPKGTDEATGQDWDQINLEHLRGLSGVQAGA